MLSRLLSLAAIPLPLAHWILQLSHASPDIAVLLATAGFCLIALELNRPGLILPGAGGLLLVLLAGASLQHLPVEAWALALLLLSAGVLLVNVWSRLSLWLLILATLALALALQCLVLAEGDRRIHMPLGICCGLLLGGLAAALSRVAFRARQAKQVN